MTTQEAFTSTVEGESGSIHKVLTGSMIAGAALRVAASKGLNTSEPPSDDALVEIMARAIWSVSAETEHGDNWAEMSVSPWGDNLREHSRAILSDMRVAGYVVEHRP